MLKIIKKYKYIITFVLILLIICLVIIRKNNLKENNKKYTIKESTDVLVKELTTNIENSKEEVLKEESKIKVDIKGQVVNPGVYELEENSRVIDVINLAGGLTDIANTSLINLSKKIEDSMVIIIYSNDEVLNSNVKEIETVFKIVEKECVCPNIKNDSCINTELDDSSNTNNDTNNDTNNTEIENNKIININTASKEELMELPSIGEAKAEAIIEYRKDNKFTTIEDIKNVSGIGESLFEKIKEYISV